MFSLLNESCPQGGYRLGHIQSNPISNQRDIIGLGLTNFPVLEHTPLESLHVYA